MYAIGAEVSVDQPVSGDVVAGGGVIQIADDVSGDVIVFGGMVQINGNVGGNVRVLGGNVTVSGNVKGDVLVFGGNVDISRTANIGKNVLFQAGMMNLDGTIAGDVVGGGGVIKIKGWIQGNADVHAQELITVSQTAKIRGNFQYSASEPVTIPDGSVSGTVKRGGVNKDDSLLFGYFSVAGLIGVGLRFLSLVLISGLGFLFISHEMTRMGDLVRKSFWRNLGIGFLGVTAGGALVILLAITVIGLPLALIFAGCGVAVWYLAPMPVAMALGEVILRKRPHSGSRRKLFGITTLGLFILALVSVIPFVGPVIWAFISLAGFGVMLRAKYEAIQGAKGRK